MKMFLVARETQTSKFRGVPEVMKVLQLVDSILVVIDVLFDVYHSPICLEVVLLLLPLAPGWVGSSSSSPPISIPSSSNIPLEPSIL